MIVPVRAIGELSWRSPDGSRGSVRNALELRVLTRIRDRIMGTGKALGRDDDANTAPVRLVLRRSGTDGGDIEIETPDPGSPKLHADGNDRGLTFDFTHVGAITGTDGVTGFDVYEGATGSDKLAGATQALGSFAASTVFRYTLILRPTAQQVEEAWLDNASAALMGATAVTANLMTVELATTGQSGSRDSDRLGGWESWHDRRVTGFPKAVDYDDPDVAPEDPNKPDTAEGNPAIEWQVSGESGSAQAKDYHGVRLTNGAPTDDTGDATRVVYVVSPYPSTDRLNANATYTVTPTVVIVAA